MPKKQVGDRQILFLQEYLVDYDIKAAAIRAGYSEATAYGAGQGILRSAKAAAYIEKRRIEIAEKLNISQERIVAELASIAFANGTDFMFIEDDGTVKIVPTSQVPIEKRPAMAGAKTTRDGIEIKLHDKLKAMELLCKCLGYCNDALDKGSVFVDAIRQAAEIRANQGEKK